MLSLHQKICDRTGHVAVAYRENMLVWGGYMEHEPSRMDHPADELFVYNCCTELWGRRLLKGDIPPCCSGACAVVLEENMYVFGGYTKEMDDRLDTSPIMYRLNLQTMTWTRLQPVGVAPLCCDKLVGWSHNNRLYFFGGFGQVPTHNVKFAWVLDPPSASAWNNQLVAYNTITNAWEWPLTYGPTPSPRAAHAADKCGSKVFVSGGRLGSVRKRDLYVLDMDNMTWSEDLNKKSIGQVPIGRSWHSFTFVSPTRAVLYGGFSTNNIVLNDCWFINITFEELEAADIRWRIEYIKPPESLRFRFHRFWHKAAFIRDTGDLLCCGGLTRADYYRHIMWQDILQEEYPNDTVPSGNLPEQSLPPPSYMEFELKYASGEPCCLHTACLTQAVSLDDAQLVILGGATQPFYETSMKLRDHPDGILVIHFTPMSLLRLSLRAVFQNSDKTQHLWKFLPRTLQIILEKRSSDVIS